MACFHPLTAYRSQTVNPSGKRSLVFNPSHGYVDLPVTIPCGQCIGCRLERSRQWAIRCVHEAQLHGLNNCFLTLTYDENHIQRLPKIINPDTGEYFYSLVKTDIVYFMKKLRKKFGEGIRFFQCGEYGEQNYRPHHHVLLFNFDFQDRRFWTIKRGVRLYRSPTLEGENGLWPFGNSTIGDVTFESAAYVARYITKKITGDKADEHYAGRLPEFITMSRRPGIARGWYDKYRDMVYPSDKCVIRDDVIARPPRYYDSIYDIQEKEEFAKIKRIRKIRALAHAHNNTPDRLQVREKSQLLKFKKLIRGGEGGGFDGLG